MNRGRILQIMPDYLLAGAERMAEYLSVELVHRGWEVFAVSLYSKHTSITDELSNAGIEVRFLGKRHGLDLSMVTKLRRLFVELRPTAIHSHRYCMQYTEFANIGLKIPHIHTVHNIANQEVPKRIQGIQRWSFRSKHAVPVAINETVKRSVCNLYHLPNEAVPIVYNGIPEYVPNPVEHVPGDLDSFTFLNIGRAMPQKNQRALVRAFVRFHESYPATKLLIIGDGEYFDEITSEIECLDARSFIFQLGQLPNARDYYYIADAFVLPSLYEGMPMTLIEAMMAGIPVLVSKRGGSVDLIEDCATGYLCEPDEVGIAEGLAHVYTDPSLRKIALSGKLASEKYTASAMADAYEEVYSQWAL